jgi:hypothetical protein
VFDDLFVHGVAHRGHRAACLLSDCLPDQPERTPAVLFVHVRRTQHGSVDRAIFYRDFRACVSQLIGNVSGHVRVYPGHDYGLKALEVNGQIGGALQTGSSPDEPQRFDEPNTIAGHSVDTDLLRRHLLLLEQSNQRKPADRGLSTSASGTGIVSIVGRPPWS